jgi:hypothetical protein
VKLKLHWLTVLGILLSTCRSTLEISVERTPDLALTQAAIVVTAPTTAAVVTLTPPPPTLTLPQSTVEPPTAVPSNPTAAPATGQPSATASPVVAVQWDTNPNALIIRHTGGLSIAGAYNPNYYIPDVQLWGDGRIIWVKTEGLARRVFEGKLTAEQMKSLLQRIVDAGFFEWQDYYDALGGNSITPRLLLVNLTGRSKEISEHGAAPPAFYELQDFIKNGAGAVGREFVPTRGYLTVTPFPGATNGELWPDAAVVGFTLDRVGEGRYIEGEALAFVWQAVNKNPAAPVYVKSNRQIYVIMAQIPGVSFYEPP